MTDAEFWRIAKDTLIMISVMAPLCSLLGVLMFLLFPPSTKR